MTGDFTLVTMFDKPYPPDKMAEGQALSLAIVTGACYGCKYLPACKTNEDFAFPAEAWCMKKKAEILKGLKL